MKKDVLDEVLACLGDERRIFHYFKDKYCLDILSFSARTKNQNKIDFREVKNGEFSRFLSKPLLQKMLHTCNGSSLDVNELYLFWPEQPLTFQVTLGRWGSGDKSWDQTTLAEHNLVLQLNFSQAHDAEYQRLIKPKEYEDVFSYFGHPINELGRNTLAWARMDINFETNEVLIEEVQNDWLRKAERALAKVKHRFKRRPIARRRAVLAQANASFSDLEHYVERVLEDYKSLWAEAVLHAAITFIRQDLGAGACQHSFDHLCRRLFFCLVRQRERDVVIPHERPITPRDGKRVPALRVVAEKALLVVAHRSFRLTKPLSSRLD